ncbi:hypothetical protein [Amycolatopsis sp. 195334CR]|uniref:hypothetical protein n=1 Tax=Amycolatopsis sp. 195334CR TaxID=2814588 RepID=UPI001A8CCF57|nr:hypothetical protein [Amycolatopsis sp. 195334CR]MBN6038477.1 hypothetical protein [Amycolatopsis sp. 195334CR]
MVNRIRLEADAQALPCKSCGFPTLRVAALLADNGTMLGRIRQVSAIFCLRNSEQNGELILKLAIDPEHRVRRVLAGAVARASEAGQLGLTEVRGIIAKDPRHSVRTALPQ